MEYKDQTCITVTKDAFGEIVRNKARLIRQTHIVKGMEGQAKEMGTLGWRVG